MTPIKHAVHYNGRSEGPRWSPDGRSIGYLGPSAQGRVLWRLDLDSGETHVVLGAPVHSFAWYRDQDHVVYVGEVSGSHVLELRGAKLGTGEEVTLLRESCGEIAISADGDSLSYCRTVSHFDMQLFFLPLTLDPALGLPWPAGEPVPLTPDDVRWHVHNGGLSPDGQHAVYTRDTDAADLFLLEKN